MINKIEQQVEKIAKPIVESYNCDFIDVEFLKESGEWYLRVYIDKEDGVTLDDCAKISRVLSDELDKVDPIEFSYFLEVSSPGEMKLLEDDKSFKKAINKIVKVRLNDENYTAIYGKLINYSENNIVINVDDEEKNIRFDDIYFIRLSGKGR
ncbi:ribosome maturation factor RimP [Thermobrachium celere]|uniref:Ribosome maturation factor RimP n=1 Tax=Thermobrachium celere DSM 8682 TaxID=941824 RepID=R7RRN5_9CLOT|nr:ribosome maturation factor RimP [Thermobrachium celere]GFR36553.1 ribosome maturation factor RimP [Thermobrachium celere]CDF57948.1 FIG000325: clustered with transcription termination protein NusA [Thermobrachium celere DSM 8682]